MTDWQMVGSIPSLILKSFASSVVKDDSSQRIRSILRRGFHFGDRVITFPYERNTYTLSSISVNAMGLQLFLALGRKNFGETVMTCTREVGGMSSLQRFRKLEQYTM